MANKIYRSLTQIDGLLNVGFEVKAYGVFEDRRSGAKNAHKGLPVTKAGKTVFQSGSKRFKPVFSGDIQITARKD